MGAGVCVMWGSQGIGIGLVDMLLRSSKWGR